MDSNLDNRLTLDEACMAFIQRRVSISVAASDERNRPEVARASGCRVSGEHGRLTVFLCPGHAARVLECLRRKGTIAVAFSRPSTHETLQIKGTVVGIAPLSDAERADMAAYRDSFVAEIVPLGYRAEFADAVIPFGEDCLAVDFLPTAIFNQTPGARAGEKLGTRA